MNLRPQTQNVTATGNRERLLAGAPVVDRDGVEVTTQPPKRVLDQEVAGH